MLECSFHFISTVCFSLPTLHFISPFYYVSFDSLTLGYKRMSLLLSSFLLTKGSEINTLMKITCVEHASTLELSKASLSLSLLQSLQNGTTLLGFQFPSLLHGGTQWKTKWTFYPVICPSEEKGSNLCIYKKMN